MLLAKIKGTIRKYRMIDPGDSVLAAVSGGPDSVCLLSALHTLANEFGFTIHIAHLDHMFRGDESAREAKFVAEFAASLGIPASIEKFDVPAYCRERGLSAQAGAREVRYDFLHRVSREIGAGRIALGHTADDQAETLLMRLLRGAGTAALAGIAPIREKIIRPLIEVTKDEVLEHLRKNALEYVTDPSNAKPVYTRNRVRLEIIPVLKKFNPEIVKALASEAAILRDENDLLETQLSALSSGIIAPYEDGILIQREKFSALAPALKRRLLRRTFEKISGQGHALAYSQIEDSISFLSSAQTGRAMQLSAGIALERRYDSFFMHPESEIMKFSVPLERPGCTLVPGILLEFNVKIIESGLAVAGEENYLWQAHFDYDKISSPLAVRSRRPGDWFCPAGMDGQKKKIQDYFVDRKVPKGTRESVPIVTSGREIIWVVGMRTDERFLPVSKTERLLMIGVRKRKTADSGGNPW